MSLISNLPRVSSIGQGEGGGGDGGKKVGCRRGHVYLSTPSRKSLRINLSFGAIASSSGGGGICQRLEASDLVQASSPTGRGSNLDRLFIISR